MNIAFSLDLALRDRCTILGIPLHCCCTQSWAIVDLLLYMSCTIVGINLDLLLYNPWTIVGINLVGALCDRWNYPCTCVARSLVCPCIPFCVRIGITNGFTLCDRCNPFTSLVRLRPIVSSSKPCKL